MKLLSMVKWAYEYLQDREDLSELHLHGMELETDNKLTGIGGSFYEESSKRGKCCVEWTSKPMTKLRAKRYVNLSLSQHELYKKVKEDGYLGSMKCTEAED